MGSQELHGPHVDYPHNGRMDALVARWALTTPDATALRWGEVELSYRQLSEQAEAERRTLAARGIGPGDIVAVRLPRGPRQVAVLLGVLATGAAYAGGSMDWPRERFDAIVRQCSARHIIDEQTPPVPAADDLLHIEPGAASDPCCVFSTSGSTGKPRAALVPHAGTVRCALDPAVGLDATSRMLQISPLGWDAMSLELWGPLINGGTSVLFEGSHFAPADLRAQIAAGLNTLFLTTSLFHAFVEEDVESFAGLRCVLAGGERISPAHVRRLRAAHPDLRIINIYGPVECSIMVTRYVVPTDGEVDEVPIGQPTANTTVRVRDGEITIYGDGVGLGYLGELQATAERFGVDDDGERHYRTGDLGSVDADGMLVFGGRADRQFKIRGTRIAPEEVEAAMDALPGVLRSVLLPVTKGSATETLACYLGTADPDEIRAHLAAHYPAAFVPRTVLCLESLPTTVNGKLDTAALIAIAELETVVDDSAGQPMSPEVARVAEAASALLDVPVGADTDLFDVGADSITVIRLASRLGLSAGAVLSGRTARIIAASAAQDHGGADAGSDAAGPDTDESWRWVFNLPMTQYRMWFIESHNPGLADMTNPLLFTVHGELDTAAFAAAVRAVIARHEALRTTLRPKSRRWIDAVPAPWDQMECKVVDHDEAAVRDFLTAPFDLAEDLPLRARIFRVGATEHVVALAVHHVAYDGWSETVLCRDLSAAYAGETLPAAPGFREVALLQVERAPATTRFWFDHLADVPEIPLVEPGEVPPGAGPVAEHRLPADGIDRAALEAVCARRRVTETVVFLAAWVCALREETGGTDFALGMPLSGRTVAEADDVVGCFASSAVIRFPSEVRSVEDCLVHGAELLERLLADQYVPLERIVLGMEPPASGRNPLCQVGFVMQNLAAGELRLAGARTERLPVAREESLYELALEINASTGDIVIWHRTDVVPPDRVARLGRRWLSTIAELDVEYEGAQR